MDRDEDGNVVGKLNNSSDLTEKEVSIEREVKDNPQNKYVFDSDEFEKEIKKMDDDRKKIEEEKKQAEIRKLEERKEKAAKLGRPDSPKNKGKLKSKF